MVRSLDIYGPLVIAGLLTAAAAGCDTVTTVGNDAGAADARILRDGNTNTPDAAPSTCIKEDLIEQDDCNAGEKCTLTDGSGSIGCAAAGFLGFYESCSATGIVRPDECGVGSLCHETDPGFNACLPFCPQLGAFCEGGMCAITVPTNSGDAYLCSPSDICDPISGSGCLTPEACYLAPVGGEVTFCGGPGTVGEAQQCSGIFDCAPGHVCFGPQGDQWCRRLCTIASPACGTNQTCLDIGGTSYGLCWDTPNP